MKEPLHRQTKENRTHSSVYLPYGYYECRIPEFFLNVPVHWHSEFELDYIVRGSGEFLFNDERTTLSEGDILILPPDTLHGAYPLENRELIYDAFVFHPRMLGTASNDRCTTQIIRPIVNGTSKIRMKIPGNLPNIEEFRTCAKKIIFCAKQNHPHYDLLLKSELLHFFWLLDDAPELVEKGSEISYSRLIRPSIEYMNAHYAETITIGQLAGLLHLSNSYFMFCFKKAVGISAIEYLTQLRINAACEKLARTGLSISEIALQCGYGNLSNFNRHFKKAVGLTPNTYRKNNSPSPPAAVRP